MINKCLLVKPPGYDIFVAVVLFCVTGLTTIVGSSLHNVLFIFTKT